MRRGRTARQRATWVRGASDSPLRRSACRRACRPRSGAALPPVRRQNTREERPGLRLGSSFCAARQPRATYAAHSAASARRRGKPGSSTARSSCRHCASLPAVPHFKPAAAREAHDAPRAGSVRRAAARQRAWIFLSPIPKTIQLQNDGLGVTGAGRGDGPAPQPLHRPARPAAARRDCRHARARRTAASIRIAPRHLDQEVIVGFAAERAGVRGRARARLTHHPPASPGPPAGWRTRSAPGCARRSAGSASRLKAGHRASGTG